jgi:hypothetical protein
MAQYMILIYEQEKPYQDLDQATEQQIIDMHTRFFGQVGELGGKVAGGERLEPSETATTIRSDVVTDGPFAETKEILGGYYIIEARDLDHALEIAKLCPAPFGGVEVRPVYAGGSGG